MNKIGHRKLEKPCELGKVGTDTAFGPSLAMLLSSYGRTYEEETKNIYRWETLKYKPKFESRWNPKSLYYFLTAFEPNTLMD
ncbi:hypothetical protein VNO77_33638 [Canavalia gladiata]|uniref:Uncharacterized protein n=1 Tax=Canavalia gladiata TaxID=3824 RepID=A0AAN9KE62_CANGL